MSNYIASLYALGYSVKEAKKGNILRHVSTIGYTAKVIQKLSRDDSFVLGRVSKGICDTLAEGSKDNKLLQVAGKGIKLAKQTDPISCLCSMIRVTKSDSPARKFVEETSKTVESGIILLLIVLVFLLLFFLDYNSYYIFFP